MAGESDQLVDPLPIESRTFFSANEYQSRRDEPNLSSPLLTFKIRIIHRIRSNTSNSYHDEMTIHSSRQDFCYPLHRLLESVDEREAVVDDTLSNSQVPFSIDASSNSEGTDHNILLWEESGSYESLEARNDVVIRISDVAARVAGDAVVAGRNLVTMSIVIEKRSTVPREEFQRVVSGPRHGFVIEDDDDYDDDNDDDDDDDDVFSSMFNWAIEQSLLESVESMRPADALAVERLEKLRYDGIRSTDQDQHQHQDDDDDDETTCVICMEEAMIGSPLIQMPCSHLFHEDCIKQWLQKRNACPLCRFSLPSRD
ncbi:hypothetical protein TIFTF001_003701 [Ficus carica]|uniref:RING-type domain-containing protein n=1 Tax=Ficus carica TaxID=3494 RepID=A0AA87Z8Y7_FICCA|nr:hypothetical protein TIFTF001_003701 [Ficus carica]